MPSSCQCCQCLSLLPLVKLLWPSDVVCFSSRGLARRRFRVLGCMGIMKKKMETTVVYWGYIGIMEKKMETTVVHGGYIGRGWSLHLLMCTLRCAI